MIRCYATFEGRNTYYAIFPWADGGTLADLWMDPDCIERTPGRDVWTLQQMLGLAKALAALHRRNCRHGDLKPQNILYFKTTAEPRLVIGDVGVSRIHKFGTLVRVEQTNTMATTPSYEAPEVSGGSVEKRSRRYDIWSLGCIFLEYVTWLLFGYGRIKEFRNERKATDCYGYFYKLLDNGVIGIHPKASEAIDQLLRHPQCGPGTPFRALVTLISERLLKVNVEERAEASELVTNLQEIVTKFEAQERTTPEGMQ